MMENYVDIHCHCLPEVDDGAESFQESREMLRMAYQDGIREIIATPHFHYRRGCATAGEIREKVQKLQESIQEELLEMKLYAGNELYYGSALSEQIENGQICRMAASDYVLIEFSPAVEFTEMQNAFFHLQMLGVLPILAHVERYACLVKKPEYAVRLSDMGIYFQANAAGILGQYGRKEKKLLHKLLKESRIHFVATDAHNTTSRSPVLSECAAYLEKKYGKTVAECCMYTNPQKIIKNERV